MSNFSVHSENMMQQYRNLGFSLTYVEDFLKEFNDYCMHEYPNETELTKELGEAWIYSSNTKSKQQLDKRVRTMKHLGRYLNSIGISAYIPNYRIKSAPSKPIVLLSDEELQMLFKAADTLTYNSRSPNRIYTVPVMMRLLYACGLRSSEVCNLKMKDVNLKTGILRIYKSKGYKDRIIYMSDSMRQLCYEYNEQYLKVVANREYFFQPSLEKKKYVNTNICSFFNTLLKNSGLIVRFTQKPTSHGLRHLFAVKSMKKCIASGGIFDNWIKYLSQYMGHSSPQETMYYLHMVSHLLPEYKSKIENFTDGMGILYEEA